MNLWLAFLVGILSSILSLLLWKRNGRFKFNRYGVLSDVVEEFFFLTYTKKYPSVHSKPKVFYFNEFAVWTNVNYASKFVSAINLLIGVNYKAWNASSIVLTLAWIFPKQNVWSTKKAKSKRIRIDMPNVYRVLYKILASIKDHFFPIYLWNATTADTLQIVYPPSSSICHHWCSMNFHALC